MFKLISDLVLIGFTAYGVYTVKNDIKWLIDNWKTEEEDVRFKISLGRNSWALFFP